MLNSLHLYRPGNKFVVTNNQHDEFTCELVSNDGHEVILELVTDVELHDGTCIDAGEWLYFDMFGVCLNEEDIYQNSTGETCSFLDISKVLVVVREV